MVLMLMWTPEDCGVSFSNWFDPPQGTPLSGQELRDAYAVAGSASPPGSSGIVGEKRQSEVSHLLFFIIHLHPHQLSNNLCSECTLLQLAT